jgi:hypothetical protein
VGGLGRRELPSLEVREGDDVAVHLRHHPLEDFGGGVRGEEKEARKDE